MNDEDSEMTDAKRRRSDFADTWRRLAAARRASITIPYDSYDSQLIGQVRGMLETSSRSNAVWCR